MCVNFKFLGLHIDNHLNWRWHIKRILPKLSTAVYTIRKLSHVLNTDVLKIVYFANFHSVIEYGIIFWGNSSNIFASKEGNKNYGGSLF
jgi:hypothetical protein